MLNIAHRGRTSLIVAAAILVLTGWGVRSRFA